MCSVSRLLFKFLNNDLCSGFSFTLICSPEIDSPLALVPRMVLKKDSVPEASPPLRNELIPAMLVNFAALEAP